MVLVFSPYLPYSTMAVAAGIRCFCFALGIWLHPYTIAIHLLKTQIASMPLLVFES